MKTLYLECNMGAAGDMLSAALLELVDCPDVVLQEINQLGLPGVSVSATKITQCGIVGTSVQVRIHGAEEGTQSDFSVHVPEPVMTLSEIQSLLMQTSLPESVKEHARAVYDALAAAESQVHGTQIEQIHFHEVGSLDAITDILLVCLLLSHLAPDQILVSPVHVGTGSIQCHHGRLPVPTPATALLLKGCPIYQTGLEGELCTPTGAALLQHFATGFGTMPTMQTLSVGYGMGKKVFPTANCIRAFWGETQSEQEDTILELSCNLDDMTPEEIGFAVSALWEAGAKEVFTTAIQMKKNRPGTLLTCLCAVEQRDPMRRLFFRHTTTLGVRERLCRRTVLSRQEQIRTTNFGAIREKTASGYGICRSKWEYEDLAALARQHDLSLLEVKQQIRKTMAEGEASCKH